MHRSIGEGENSSKRNADMSFSLFPEEEVEEGLPGINRYVIVNVYNNTTLYIPPLYHVHRHAVEASLFSRSGGVHVYMYICVETMSAAHVNFSHTPEILTPITCIGVPPHFEFCGPCFLPPIYDVCV